MTCDKCGSKDVVFFTAGGEMHSFTDKGIEVTKYKGKALCGKCLDKGEE